VFAVVPSLAINELGWHGSSHNGGRMPAHCARRTAAENRRFFSKAYRIVSKHERAKFTEKTAGKNGAADCHPMMPGRRKNPQAGHGSLREKIATSTSSSRRC